MENIGALAYKVKFDARELTSGVLNARKQTREYNKIMQAAKSPMDKYADGLENLRGMVSRFPKLLKHQAALQKDLEAQYLRDKRAVEGLTNSEQKRLGLLTREERALKSAVKWEKNLTLARKRRQKTEQTMDPAGGSGIIGRAAGLFIGGSAAFAGKEFLQNAIQTHAQIERNTAAFEVFTGSVAGATQMMANLRSLSAQSGVSFEALQGGASTFLSFGGAIKDTLPALKQMAEITRGDKERFSSMVLAFSQASAAGKLMGQDLLQMINAGFNPLLQISETTGKSIAELRKEMEAGNISFDMVKEAFRDATEEGGRFNGMLDNIATTSSGAINRVNSQWEVFKDAVGESLEGPTKVGATIGSNMLTLLTARVQGFQALVDATIEHNRRLGKSGIKAKEIKQEMELDRQLKEILENNERHQKVVRELEERKKREEEAAKAAEAAKPTEAGKDRIRQLQIELGIIDKQKAMREDLAADGLNKAEVERVMHLTRQLELMEQQKKQAQEQEAFRKKQQREQERLQQNYKKQADAIRDRHKTDTQQLGERLGQLQFLRQRGLLDQRSFMMERQSALRDFSREQQPLQNAALATRGSQEIYRIADGRFSRTNTQTQQLRETVNLMRAEKIASATRNELLNTLVQKVEELGDDVL